MYDPVAQLDASIRHTAEPVHPIYCSKCKTSKPDSEFHPADRHQFYSRSRKRSTWCKRCRYVAREQYRQRNLAKGYKYGDKNVAHRLRVDLDHDLYPRLVAFTKEGRFKHVSEAVRVILENELPELT